MDTDIKATVERTDGSCCGQDRAAAEDPRPVKAQGRPFAGRSPKAVPEDAEFRQSGSKGCCCG